MVSRLSLQGAFIAYHLSIVEIIHKINYQDTPEFLKSHKPDDKSNLELDSHIPSFQFSVTLYEVYSNYFFKIKNTIKNSRDLIYFQGHILSGIYVLIFLEDHLFSEKKINNF